MTAEAILEETYLGKIVSYDRVARPTVYGRMERLGLEVWKKPFMVAFTIGEIRYTEALEDFESLITLL